MFSYFPLSYFSKNYVMGWERISQYEIRMTLVIKDFGKNDLGTYMCVAANTVGRADGTIRLYGKFNPNSYRFTNLSICASDKKLI